MNALHGHSVSHERRVIIRVDLVGSRLGPKWLGVDVELSPPDDWDDERIRSEAARYYGVPMDQVDAPRPKTSGEMPDSEDPDLPGW